jgi:hypothetical protein
MASRSSCSALMRPCSNLMTSSLCVIAGAWGSYCDTPVGVLPPLYSLRR